MTRVQGDGRRYVTENEVMDINPQRRVVQDGSGTNRYLTER